MKNRTSPGAGGRRFLISGCASGIGRRLAEVLHERGERVTATDLDEAALRGHFSGHESERLRLARLDVTDPAAWNRVADEAVAAWGGLDAVLNVAGYVGPGSAHEASPAEVDRHFDVNAKGVVYGTQAAARRMIPNGAGHILNVASLASLVPSPGLALYSASKYAVRAFSLAAAEELREHGIAVTVVCPDAVATPMLIKQLDYPEAALTFTAPRFLQTDEVVAAILDRALVKRPLLLSLPRRRAALARFVDLWPRASRWLAPSLRRQGLKRQAQLVEARQGRPRDGS